MAAIVLFVVFPVIMLVKISSIDRRMGNLERLLDQKPVAAAPRQTTAVQPHMAEQHHVHERGAIPVEKTAPVVEAVFDQEPVQSNVDADVPVVAVGITEKPHVTQQAPAIAAGVETHIATTSQLPVNDVVREQSSITPFISPFDEERQQNWAEKIWERNKSSIKSLFTENWLSKVGIITLVLGVAFFVKYAIDQDWINETGRVGIGILAGAAILFAGHRLRRNYHLLSSLLVGGGIAVFYITIAIAYREYHLFGPTAAFSILVGITVLAVCLALLYNRQELALLSLLGGYASPLLASSGTGNYVVLFTFLLILNAGMLVAAMRRKWNLIGVMSYICTLGFLWGWLAAGYKEQYGGATLFAALFFVQFYLLALFDYFRAGRITVFQTAVILSNNLSLLLACTLIFDNYTHHIMGLVTILIGAANAVVMGVLMRRGNVDKRMLYMVIGLVLSFVSLAVPVQLEGHVITMFWAAEAVILLVLWQRSRIRVFHGAFLVMCVLVLISYSMDAAHNYSYSYLLDYPTEGGSSLLPVILNRMFITGLIVIASLGLCRWLIGRDAESEGGVVPARHVARAVTFALIAMGFLVPFIEIGYQLEHASYPLDAFRSSAMMIWLVTYAAAMAAVFRKHIAGRPWVYALLSVVLVLFVCGGLSTINDFRTSIFSDNISAASRSYFLLHYLMWPGVAYLFYALVRNAPLLPRGAMTWAAWLLTVLGVVVLSVEADSTTVQIAGEAENYRTLLHDVHTFGYPILWGIVAAGLMVWGLRRKEVLLRQIALVFFGLIILKFYTTDVWLMSQGGRIVSFVALGVILLIVSFLQQRIKTLVRDNDANDDNSEKTDA